MNKKVNPFNIILVAYCIVLDTVLSVIMGVIYYDMRMQLSFVLEIALVVVMAYLCFLANKPLKRTERGRFATKVAIIVVDIISVHVLLASLIYLYFTTYLTAFLFLMLILFVPIIMCIIARKKLDEAIFRKDVFVFSIVVIAVGILVPVFLYVVAYDLLAVTMGIPYFIYLATISYVAMIVPAVLLLTVRYPKM